jgi:TonB-dependent SusC/RagA subfamily outer membrane receptor
LEKAAEPNLANNLVGKVAGLNILSKSNLFENPEILLRGKGTLVVIDGVPTNKDNFDFWNLNPNDIDNINVLKGTAAAALFGSLGINGAIMITTKKGKAGDKGVEISYNTTTQFQAGYLRVPNTQSQYGMGWSGYYAFINGKGGGGWYDDYGMYGDRNWMFPTRQLQVAITNGRSITVLTMGTACTPLHKPASTMSVTINPLRG